MRKILALNFVVICVFFAGCATKTHYEHIAVERARLFVLEKLNDLSESKLNDIRTIDPIITHFPILEKKTIKTTTVPRNLLQFCVVWKVDWLKKPLVVVGKGSTSLKNWVPMKAVVREIGDLDSQKPLTENDLL